MSDNLFVLKREASKQPLVVEVDGESLSIPHVADVDQFELADLFARADDMDDLSFITSFFRVLMTEDEFARLRGLKLDRGALSSLYKAVMDHAGTDSGESPASST